MKWKTSLNVRAISYLWPLLLSNSCNYLQYTERMASLRVCIVYCWENWTIQSSAACGVLSGQTLTEYVHQYYDFVFWTVSWLDSTSTVKSGATEFCDGQDRANDFRAFIYGTVTATFRPRLTFVFKRPGCTTRYCTLLR